MASHPFTSALRFPLHPLTIINPLYCRRVQRGLQYVVVSRVFLAYCHHPHVVYVISLLPPCTSRFLNIQTHYNTEKAFIILIFAKNASFRSYGSFASSNATHQLHLSPKIRIRTEFTQHGHDITIRDFNLKKCFIQNLQYIYLRPSSTYLQYKYAYVHNYLTST